MINDVLYDLYAVCSKSRKESPMVEFISSWVYENLEDVKFEEDKHHNLYITKGEATEYPCVVAHMDEVHEPNANKEVIYYENCIFGYDRVKHSTTGIGADDKNGIYIAMMMLLKYPVLKVAFFVSEEIGCIGSRACDLSFFDDCRFVIQCDRRDNSDFINVASGTTLCSDEFIKDCKIADFGYHLCNGLSTDVMALKEQGLKVSCVNLSCGYYNPHKENECTVMEDLEKCQRFVEYIIENLTKVYPHEPKKALTRTYGVITTAGTTAGTGTKKPSYDNFVFKTNSNSRPKINSDNYDDRLSELELCKDFIGDYLSTQKGLGSVYDFYQKYGEFFDYINYADITRIYYKERRLICANQ